MTTIATKEGRKGGREGGREGEGKEGGKEELWKERKDSRMKQKEGRSLGGRN